MSTSAQVSRMMPAVNVDDADVDTTFTQIPRGFIPTTDGVVRTTNASGVAIDIPVKGGAVYPIQLRDVVSVGTTAGTVVLLY